MFLNTHIEIKDWLRQYHINNYTINENLIVDVHDSVNLGSKRLKNIPIRFGTVKGSFNCSHNKLTSLEGSPIKSKTFDCSYNDLETLLHCPSEIENYFDCSYNALTSLQHGPKHVGDFYSCRYNKITELIDMPNEIYGYVDCSHNELKSLKGIPNIIHGLLDVNNNHLTSFQYITIVGEDLMIGINPIDSIEFIPQHIGRNIILYQEGKLIKELDGFYSRDRSKYDIIDIPFKELKKIELKYVLDKELNTSPNKKRNKI